MTRGRKGSKGESDERPSHLEITSDGLGIDDRGKMQHATGVETSETEPPDPPPAISSMIPLTQSKMHAQPAPAPEQPVLPRRSALVIEILSFVLIAFLVVSALLFNFATPERLINAPSGVTVQLPPMSTEPGVALPAAAPVAKEDHSTTEAASPSSAALPDVQPEAAGEKPEAAVETSALPPAAAPVSPEPATDTTIEAMPEPAPISEPVPMPALETAPAPIKETASLPLPAEEMEALIRHGDELLGMGDIAAARSTYERAAASGNRVAAMGVAKTYDPIYLTQAGVRGLRGDPARAAFWYGKAAAAGDRQAQQRLRQLRAQFPQ